ncbi:MAG: peptidylprolyl isomerase [Gammaproteobacteria bacterium]
MEKNIIIVIVVILIGYFFLRNSGGANSEEIAANKKAGAEFMQTNKMAQGVKTTNSGLQYLVLQSGTGSQHPSSTDRVKVHYEGKLLDGAVFDSSVQRGEPISFALNQVIKGWTEGLQLMVVGEKTRFFIPATIAYGNKGAGRDIPGGSTLTFDVELLGINE